MKVIGCLGVGDKVILVFPQDKTSLMPKDSSLSGGSLYVCVLKDAAVKGGQLIDSGGGGGRR